MGIDSGSYSYFYSDFEKNNKSSTHSDRVIFFSDKFEFKKPQGYIPGYLCPYILALLSKLAYEFNSVLYDNEQLKQFGWQCLDYSDSGNQNSIGCRLYVSTKYGRYKVFAFAGSCELDDWIEDFNHLFGRKNQYLQQSQDFVKSHQAIGGEMIFTGHSLGGYIAIYLSKFFQVKTCSFNSFGGGLSDYNKLKDEISIRGSKIINFVSSVDIATIANLSGRVLSETVIQGKVLGKGILKRVQSGDTPVEVYVKLPFQIFNQLNKLRVNQNNNSEFFWDIVIADKGWHLMSSVVRFFERFGLYTIVWNSGYAIYTSYSDEETYSNSRVPGM